MPHLDAYVLDAVKHEGYQRRNCKRPVTAVPPQAQRQEDHVRDDESCCVPVRHSPLSISGQRDRARASTRNCLVANMQGYAAVASNCTARRDMGLCDCTSTL